MSFDALLNKKLQQQEKKIREEYSLELQALRSLVSRLSRRIEKLENRVQSYQGKSYKPYKNEDYDISIDQKSTLVIRQRSGSGTDIPTFSPIHSSPKSTNSKSLPPQLNTSSILNDSDNNKTPKQTTKKFGVSHSNVKARMNKLQNNKNPSSSSPQSTKSYSSQHDHEDSLNSIDDDEEENLESPQPKELSLSQKTDKMEVLSLENTKSNNKNDDENNSKPKPGEPLTSDKTIEGEKNTNTNKNENENENDTKKPESPLKVPISRVETPSKKKKTPKTGSKSKTKRSGSIQNNPFLKNNKQTRKRRNSSAKASTGTLLSSTGTGGSRVKSASQIHPKIGNRYLLLDDRYGICKYYNSKMKVLGIHLEVGEGNCDGTTKKGLRRFKCPKNKGVFVKLEQIQRDCGKV